MRSGAWISNSRSRQQMSRRSICMAARELFSGRLVRLWEGEFGAEPPFRTDSRALFVAYLASAELNCFRQLGWSDPVNVLDLYVEHRWLKNGLPLPEDLRPHKLLTMLDLFGLDAIDAAEKDDMRRLAIRGGPFTGEERGRLLEYCQSDVDALAELLPRVERLLDWPRALLRGEYLKVVSAMETRGIPIDVDLFVSFKANWDMLRRRIIDSVADRFDLFRGR